MSIFLRYIEYMSKAATFITTYTDPTHSSPEVLIKGHNNLVHETNAQSLYRLAILLGKFRLKFYLPCFQDSEGKTRNHFLGTVHWAVSAGDSHRFFIVGDFSDNFLQLNRNVIGLHNLIQQSAISSFRYEISTLVFSKLIIVCWKLSYWWSFIMLSHVY